VKERRISKWRGKLFNQVTNKAKEKKRHKNKPRKRQNKKERKQRMKPNKIEHNAQRSYELKGSSIN